MDVWFESGSTHAFVLGRPGLSFPADLYLEGSDQHRGWFQSSLLESVGTRGVSPYKALVTNGFVLDEQGRKMSKSLGNVIAPQDVNDSMGADVLRLWVMNSDTNDDLRIGKEILKQQGELYRRLRNTLRWLLGGLDGFTDAEVLPYAELPELERWVLHRLSELGGLVARAVETHEWVGVYPALHGFCTTDLSAFYFDIRKDALYCDAPSSPTRRAVRTVLDVLHRCLSTWLAPVLVFTAEEAWAARFGDQASVHEQAFPDLPVEWTDTALEERWARIRSVRRIITTEIEGARRAGTIGSSLQAQVELTFSEEEASIFAGVNWSELAIVSHVEVLIDPHLPPFMWRGMKGEPCMVRLWSGWQRAKNAPAAGRSCQKPGRIRRILVCAHAVRMLWPRAALSAHPRRRVHEKAVHAPARRNWPACADAGSLCGPAEQVLDFIWAGPASPWFCQGIAVP